MPTTTIETAPQAERMLRPERLGDHLDRLYRAALAMTRNPHDAENLVQETYVRVLARPRRLTRGDEAGYLLRALRNVFLDTHARRPAPIPSDQIETLVDARRGGIAGPDAALESREVLRAVADLPPEFRDAVVAVDVMGLSYGEAARSIGVPDGTVMSRVYRGRERVAKRLG